MNWEELDDGLWLLQDIVFDGAEFHATLKRKRLYGGVEPKDSWCWAVSITKFIPGSRQHHLYGGEVKSRHYSTFEVMKAECEGFLNSRKTTEADTNEDAD